MAVGGWVGGPLTPQYPQGGEARHGPVPQGNDAAEGPVQPAAGARSSDRLATRHAPCAAAARHGQCRGCLGWPEQTFVAEVRLHPLRGNIHLALPYAATCRTASQLTPLQELKGNIRVYCRVRPLSSAEKQHDSPRCGRAQARKPQHAAASRNMLQAAQRTLCDHRATCR